MSDLFDRVAMQATGSALAVRARRRLPFEPREASLTGFASGDPLAEAERGVDAAAPAIAPRSPREIGLRDTPPRDGLPQTSSIRRARASSAAEVAPPNALGKLDRGEADLSLGDPVALAPEAPAGMSGFAAERRPHRAPTPTSLMAPGEVTPDPADPHVNLQGPTDHSVRPIDPRPSRRAPNPEPLPALMRNLPDDDLDLPGRTRAMPDRWTAGEEPPLPRNPEHGPAEGPSPRVQPTLLESRPDPVGSRAEAGAQASGQGPSSQFTDPLGVQARARLDAVTDPAQNRTAAPPPPPSIEVTIGRLEIRAPGPNAAPDRKPVRAFAPHLDLAAYRGRREQAK